MDQVRRLLDKIEELEEENRQLKERFGFVDRIPDQAKLRSMHIYASGFKLLHLLSRRRIVRKDDAYLALWPDGNEPEFAETALYVHLSHLRKSLKQHGIEIVTVWREGWSMNENDRQKSRQLIAEIME